MLQFAIAPPIEMLTSLTLHIPHYEPLPGLTLAIPLFGDGNGSGVMSFNQKLLLIGSSSPHSGDALQLLTSIFGPVWLALCKFCDTAKIVMQRSQPQY